MSIFKVPSEDQWQNVELSEVDFSDENFGFLGAFEEFLPGTEGSSGDGDELAESVGKGGKSKKNTKRKKQEEVVEDEEIFEMTDGESFGEEDDDEEPEEPVTKKKKLTNKEKKAAAKGAEILQFEDLTPVIEPVGTVEKTQQKKGTKASGKVENASKQNTPAPGQGKKKLTRKERKMAKIAAQKGLTFTPGGQENAKAAPKGKTLDLRTMEVTLINNAEADPEPVKKGKKVKGEKAVEEIVQEVESVQTAEEDEALDEIESDEEKEEEDNEEGEEGEESEEDEEVEDEADEASVNGDGEKKEATAAYPIPQLDLSEWAPFYLPEELMKGINDLGFKQPSEIQRLILPSACRDRLDILGAAETGSGKTLAYAIPAIMRMLEEKDAPHKGPRVLIIAPTRELVVQVRKHVDALLKYTKFRATSIFGGLAKEKQERVLKWKPDVIVASPGRLWALMDGKDAVDYLADMSDLRCLVIDETDRMVEKGHFEELDLILTHVRRFATTKLQTLVFSATLTYVHPAPKWMNNATAAQLTPQEKLKHLIDMTGLRKQRKVIDITRQFGTAEKLVETRMNCVDLLDKDISVLYLLNRYRGRTLIFTNSIDAARRLYGILSKLKQQPTPMLLHARMHQKQRLKSLEKFAKEPNSILLATDVAARGLDIKGIEHVIHYQVPKTAELYIHRSGRTARAAATGLTVLLVDQKDAGYYKRICRNLNREKDLPIFPVDSPTLFAALKARVKCAAEIDGMEHRQRKVLERESWFEKAAKEADMDLDERSTEMKNASREVDDLKREEKVQQKLLRMLLTQPLPRCDKGTMPKTRYITPAISKQYDQTITDIAIDSFKVQHAAQEKTKKLCRKNKWIKTRDVQMSKKEMTRGKK